MIASEAIPVPRSRTVVLRLSGDVSTKSSHTRKRFNERLVRNIESALARAGIDAEIEEHWFRIDVHTDDVAAPEVLARVFGIQGIVPTLGYDWDSVEDVVETGEDLFSERVGGTTFGVQTRRVGHKDRIPFTSNDVDVALGQRLVDAGGTVDLDDPEVVVGVEVRADGVYYFSNELPGPGGIPNGVEGRALALVSGGFDSAVAAWMLLKRGVDLDFLFFNLGGRPHEQGVRHVTRELAELWCHGYAPAMHVVDLRPVLADLKTNVWGQYWQLLLKRVMMRAADRIALDEGYPVLVTGEAVAQVSSQTLANIAAIQGPIRTPILRPLVGFNKDEITAKAEIVGTYEISAGVPEFCALEGGKPVTRADVHELDKVEARLTMELVDMAVDDQVRLDVLQMDLLDDLDVRIDHVPDDAVVIDLRTAGEYEKWSHPDSMHFEFRRAVEAVPKLPRQGTYLLYCDVGLKSAFLAEAMRDMGFDEAYSFSGGIRGLKKYVKG